MDVAQRGAAATTNSPRLAMRRFVPHLGMRQQGCRLPRRFAPPRLHHYEPVKKLAKKKKLKACNAELFFNPAAFSGVA
jgi:hypothetical protein